MVRSWFCPQLDQCDGCAVRQLLNADIILDCRDGIKMHSSTGSKKAESRPGHKKSCLKSLESLQFKVRSNNEALRWFCTCPIDIMCFGEVAQNDRWSHKPSVPLIPGYLCVQCEDDVINPILLCNCLATKTSTSETDSNPRRAKW